MNSSDPFPDKPAIERFLDRYIVVWIWSVVFGAGTGLFYSATDINIRSWGFLTVLLVVPAAATLGSALVSWWHLYRGLRVYILPLLLGADAAPGPEARSLLAYHLRRSFAFVLWSAFFRGTTALIQVLLVATSKAG